ncbi:hypothetical protein ACS0PU_003186 [Formica fusca]
MRAQTSLIATSCATIAVGDSAILFASCSFPLRRFLTLRRESQRIRRRECKKILQNSIEDMRPLRFRRRRKGEIAKKTSLGKDWNW